MTTHAPIQADESHDRPRAAAVLILVVPVAAPHDAQPQCHVCVGHCASRRRGAAGAGQGGAGGRRAQEAGERVGGERGQRTCDWKTFDLYGCERYGFLSNLQGAIDTTPFFIIPWVLLSRAT